MSKQMHDDERRLLGAAQVSGKIVPVAEMTEQRLNGLRKKWLMLNLIDADGNLTRKGHGASGGVKPAESVAKPIEQPVVLEPVAPIEQGTYIGSPLMDDNEIETDATVCEPEEFDDELDEE